MSLTRKLSGVQKKKIAEKQLYSCAQCKFFPLPSTYQVDHIVPHAVGGSDNPLNLQALCPNCHARKTQDEATRISKFKRKKKLCGPNMSPCWCCLKKKSFEFFKTFQPIESAFESAFESEFESEFESQFESQFESTFEPVCNECEKNGREIKTYETKKKAQVNESSHIKKYKEIQNDCDIYTRVCFLCLKTYSAYFKHNCLFEIDNNKPEWWDKYAYSN
jgi:hypothetical protein